MTARKFGRQNLNSGGSQLLLEFIRPEVRARLDEEPVGDADAGFDPGASGPSSGSDQAQGAESVDDEIVRLLAEEFGQQAELPREHADFGSIS